jgi:two-component system sensor histidine kinase EvgS
LFSIQARGKNIELSVLDNQDEVDNGLTMELDPGKVAQVLRNYISNAIKFTPEGGVVRVIAFERRVADVSSVVVQVVDSGVGMTPVQLGKIFNEIVQFNANSLQGGGGSGLGLW